jgi:hypothetical protein
MLKQVVNIGAPLKQLDAVLTCVGTEGVQTETAVCNTHSLTGNTELRRSEKPLGLWDKK